MESSSSSARGLFLSSISLSHRNACSCSGVIVTRWPGDGVARPIALGPTGVAVGVIDDGVIDGVCGVMPASGVSSHLKSKILSIHLKNSHRIITDLLRLLEAEGVSSGAILSVLGVSAQPE